MKHILCSIKDRALDAYMPIFQVRHEQQAIRAFTDAINNPQEPIAAHPEDYELHIVGYFDDNTGKLDWGHEKHELPHPIALGHKVTKGA